MLQSVATPRPILVQRGGYFVRQGFVCAFPKKTQIFLDLPGMKQPLPDSESLRCGCCDKTPSFSSFFFPPESFVSTYTDSHKRMAQITMQQITVRQALLNWVYLLRWRVQELLTFLQIQCKADRKSFHAQNAQKIGDFLTVSPHNPKFRWTLWWLYGETFAASVHSRDIGCEEILFVLESHASRTFVFGAILLLSGT